MQIMMSRDLGFRPDSNHVALLQNPYVQNERFLPALIFFDVFLCSEHYALCLRGSLGIHMAWCLLHTAERQCGLVERAQAKSKFTGGVDLGKLFKSLSSSITVCEMGNG